MAIAIKNIPVLTGKNADYFNRMAEEERQKPTTHIPKNMISIVRSLAERSKQFVVKK